MKSGLRRNPRIFYLYMEMIKICRKEKIEREVWEPYAKRALHLFQWNPENMRKMGDRMMEANSPDLAELAYSRSLRANPRQPVLYTVLSSVYRRNQKDDEALELLRKGAEIFPNNRGITRTLQSLEDWLGEKKKQGTSE
jgi:hypothetical protein